MSGEALYERYKDALKRGHVASLRGRPDEALAAYAEAATIAPERSTPHSSAGTALLRSRRPAEALGHFDVALRLLPGDEVALLGRAQALASLDRRAEAAGAFDTLAEVRAAAGRLGDAVDAARRGLELAEARHRRRTLGLLIERLRQSEPDEPGRVALERALLVLEGAEVASGGAPDADLEPEPGDIATAVPAGAPDAEPAVAGTADVSGDADLAGGVVPASAMEPPPPRAALDRDIPADPDLEAMTRDAEAALDRGDPETPSHYLDLAAACLRTRCIDAALDACYVALSIAPDDMELHLALAELYDERDWRSLATEKLDLLARLAELDGDAGPGGRVAMARAGRG